jgi:hypothetical protein
MFTVSLIALRGHVRWLLWTMVDVRPLKQLGTTQNGDKMIRCQKRALQESNLFCFMHRKFKHRHRKKPWAHTQPQRHNSPTHTEGPWPASPEPALLWESKLINELPTTELRHWPIRIGHCLQVSIPHLHGGPDTDQSGLDIPPIWIPYLCVIA